MIPRIRRMKMRAGPARTGTPTALAQTTYPSIGHAMLLHGEQLIYSTLPLGATKALHRFLVATFLAPHLDLDDHEDHFNEFDKILKERLGTIKDSDNREDIERKVEDAVDALAKEIDDRLPSKEGAGE